MKPARILVALATVAGIATSVLYVPSDANVTPPAGDEAASFIKAEEIIQYGQPNRLSLQSSVAIVMDDREGIMLYGRNVDRPIATASAAHARAWASTPCSRATTCCARRSALPTTARPQRWRALTRAGRRR